MKDKKVLVVGGSSGIGLAVAKLAVSQGAKVAIASRSAEDKSEALGVLVKGVRCLAMDVCSEDDIVGLFQQTGRIDHLVMTVKPEMFALPFLKAETSQVMQGFETKFWGQYRLAKMGQQYIKPGGSIVFSSGIASHRPYEGYSMASITNGAIEALCKILAVELAPIRVNAVSPGFAETENRKIQKMSSKFPLKRLGKTSEIANAYLFLMKDAYTTGTTLTSDGGATLV